MASNPFKPYVLCGLVAVILLEPVLAKWRFPLSKNSGLGVAADSTTAYSPQDVVLGIVPGGSVDTGTVDRLASTRQVLRELFEWDWEKVKEFPGVKVPIEAARWAKGVILYQPPVGIITAWTVYHLVKSGRLFWWKEDDQKGRLEGASDLALSQKSSRLDRHFGRALDLDKDDLEYRNFGGVERVRRRLLWNALEESGSRLIPSAEGPEPLHDLVASLLQAMKVSFPPGGSHADHLNELLISIASAEYAWMHYDGKADPELNKLLEIAMQTAENRVLDSLVRLARDRLVRTCFRLGRTVQHWKKRVQSQSGMWPLARQFMAGSFEGDRMRLAFAESAYKSEVARLGRVVSMLSDRPEGMDDSFLQLAIKKTYTMETMEPKPQPAKRQWLTRLPHLPDISNWSIRFNADGRGKIQVQNYEDALRIGGPGALEVLLQESDQQEWIGSSKVWATRARTMLVEVLDEMLETSIQANVEHQIKLHKLKTTWMVQEFTEGRGTIQVEPEHVTEQWHLIFGMVRDLHQFRRVGDGKSVKWRDANLIHFVRQWDLLGIPSALVHIGLAQVAHNRIIPHWPKIQSFVHETFEIANEIFQTRFWYPIRDLMTELMYRDKNSLLTGILVTDEETSLDFMLRDLNFGDGTPATRHEAIVKATRQYENDMATGLMRHAIGGRLIRLILIQVQQLKVGMLHAADTVDVLLQTNRFNIQLLAVIPAFVIVTVGTKIFFRFLYTLRHKDLRPMSFVHSEMTGYLNKLESILLLADGHLAGKSRGDVSSLEALSDHELGEFILNLYEYLVLLDYSSPTPFPGWQCDSIHQTIVEFLGPKGSLSRMGLQDQVRLIDHIKRKHDDLAKHL
jgi:nuclear control of ATPase protein 2